MSITSEGKQVTDSLNGKLNFEQDKNRIIGRDGDNTPRLAIVADGVNFSMKTSPFGVDVLTASDDDLTFNSDRNMLKVIDTGTATITLPNPLVEREFYEVVEPHNLGYPPAILAFVEYPGGISPIPYTTFTPPGFPFGIQLSFTVNIDNTNIYFDIQANNFFDGSTFDFTYYLLEETAN